MRASIEEEHPSILMSISRCLAKPQVRPAPLTQALDIDLLEWNALLAKTTSRNWQEEQAVLVIS